MSETSRDYIEFLDAILLFRTARDMDCSCSPGPPPELWLDLHMESLATDCREDPDYYTDEVVQWLSLAAKMAELIDDRKAWLLKEIEDDLDKIINERTAKLAA